MKMVGAMFGMHAPIRLARERLLVSHNRRLPPLRSSMMSLEILMDKDASIDFDDFLNSTLSGVVGSCPVISSAITHFISKMNFDNFIFLSVDVPEDLGMRKSVHDLIEQRMGFEKL